MYLTRLLLVFVLRKLYHTVFHSFSRAPKQAQPKGETFPVRILKVVDGDTLDVRQNGTIVRLRLVCIDAPEHNQPFGEESARRLGALVDKIAIVTPFGSDCYGRLLAAIEVDGWWINLELVKEGLAWATNDAPPDMQAAQDNARRNGLGLWAPELPAPVAPWDFRRASCAS